METVEKLLDVMGGGWLSLGVLLALGIFLLWIQAKERKARRDRARHETQQGRLNDQANTVVDNQSAQDEWDEASDEIDDIRSSIGSSSKKKRPREE